MPTRRTVLSTLLQSAALASPLVRRLSLAQTPSAPEPASPHDPLRPAFHYLPARNWMNDPCAPTFYRGQYHMFHQYNPHSAIWGDMNWAHATSPDMIHWQRQPIALAPTANSPDTDGCFTGSSLRLPDGTPAIIYTGVEEVPHADATLSDGHHNFRETQLLAIAGSPGLGTWRKRSQPVIPTPPPGLTVTGFRDPSPFTHAGKQFLIAGSGVARKGGMILLYRSSTPDLTQWEYLHPLTQDLAWSSATNPHPPSTLDPTHPDPVSTGEMWECPDFFPLDGRHVLIISTRRRTLWRVGDLDPATLTFHPTATGELDGGRSFYAPKTQLDSHGSRILWGWLSETRPEADYAAAGWSGMLSLPRVLSIRNGQLAMRPLPALSQLRTTSQPNGAVDEFTATLSPGSSASTPQSVIFRDATGPLLTIGAPIAADASSAIPRIDVPHLNSPIQLHAFFDNSVLELFVNDTFCHTHRFYRRDPDAPIAALNLPGNWTLSKQQSFALRPIWPA